MKLKKKFKLFSSSEELISMFLGLVIVVVIGGLIFNFIHKRKGKVNAPGVNVVQESEKDLLTNGSAGGEYIVKQGDNLWKIAVATYNDGYKWTEIAKANNLKNPGLLEKDQKLVLPKIEVKEVAQAGTTIEQKDYTVQVGDSLWSICVANYNDGYQWTNVWNANKETIKNPSKIEIGMKIILPKFTSTTVVLN